MIEAGGIALLSGDAGCPGITGREHPEHMAGGETVPGISYPGSFMHLLIVPLNYRYSV